MKNDNVKAIGVSQFREATMEMDQVYSLFSRACRLSEPEYWSLLLIYEGVRTQREISSQLYMSRQTLNSAFRQLVKKGLIRLKICEGDQRSKQAFLTEEGIGFVETYLVRMHRLEEEAWMLMTEEERAVLVENTRKYSSLLRELLQNNLRGGTENPGDGEDTPECR